MVGGVLASIAISTLLWSVGCWLLLLIVPCCGRWDAGFYYYSRNSIVEEFRPDPWAYGHLILKMYLNYGIF